MSASLLSINLTDIQNKLESMDYIEAVLASRIFPNTLIIHIVERSPILLLAMSDQTAFMDKKGTLLPANEKSIGIFPVPVLSILDDNEQIDKYLGNITPLFQFLLAKYPIFYKNLSEVKIKEGVWEFYSDNNTKIYAHDSYLMSQLNILKIFEKTVHPMRDLQDYHYIDLRIKDQVIVKEKYRKG
jgi:cell division septal protein FtsQ